MLRRMCARVSTATAAVALLVGMAAPVGAMAEPRATAGQSEQTVLSYDTSRAEEYADEVEEGMDIWNSEVDNVRLEPVEPGEQANIVVVADDGWPRAELGPVGPDGQVTWWFGAEAEQDGYDPVRTAAHETGHSLGLPDMKPGPCSSLMSGSSAGVDCDNPVPDDQEQSQVEQNYADSAVGESGTDGDGPVVVDRP